MAKLQAAQIENLRILTVEGANHQFKDMLDEFIAQIDLLVPKYDLPDDDDCFWSPPK